MGDDLQAPGKITERSRKHPLVGQLNLARVGQARDDGREHRRDAANGCTNLIERLAHCASRCPRVDNHAEQVKPSDYR